LQCSVCHGRSMQSSLLNQTGFPCKSNWITYIQYIEYIQHLGESHYIFIQKDTEILGNLPLMRSNDILKRVSIDVN
jgi:hypothetical protein